MITTCSKCEKLYEAGSEEQANEPDRKCPECTGPVYFGIPGHCFDIDGYLWHEPGQCAGASVNCNGKCCGYIKT